MPITALFPASGVNLHTVWLTPLGWWRQYVHEVQAHLKSQESTGGGKDSNLHSDRQRRVR